MKIEDALYVFVNAFAFGKSFAHPYLAERIDGLWVMHDGPGRKTPRKIEVVTTGLDPSDVVRRIHRAQLGWHFVCDVHPLEADFDSIRRAYKELGYRAVTTEWLFVNDLADLPVFDSDPPARQVASQSEADAIPQLATHKVKLRAGSRQFGIWDEDRDYGWVRSVPILKHAWVADLLVRRDVRGRGYGRSLMSSLLQVDREHGVEASVLLASSDGARLYPHLGYRRIGVLQAFCPAERDRGISDDTRPAPPDMRSRTWRAD